MSIFTKTGVACFVGLGLMLQFSVSEGAAISCPAMQVVNVSQQSTWLKNVSGAACGNIPNNSKQYFVFNPATVDRLLALTLTAVSLNKNLWVHALGDAEGSIVDIISINN